jgi:hypothetical protein
MILDSAVDAKRLAVNVAANLRGLPAGPSSRCTSWTPSKSSGSPRQ